MSRMLMTFIIADTLPTLTSGPWTLYDVQSIIIRSWDSVGSKTHSSSPVPFALKVCLSLSVSDKYWMDLIYGLRLYYLCSRRFENRWYPSHSDLQAANSLRYAECGFERDEIHLAWKCISSSLIHFAYRGLLTLTVLVVNRWLLGPRYFYARDFHHGQYTSRSKLCWAWLLDMCWMISERRDSIMLKNSTPLVHFAIWGLMSMFVFNANAFPTSDVTARVVVFRLFTQILSKVRIPINIYVLLRIVCQAAQGHYSSLS